MMKTMAVAALLGSAWAALADETKAKSPGAEETGRSVFEFKVQSIDGQEVSLSKYKGDVLLIVNVASL